MKGKIFIGQILRANFCRVDIGFDFDRADFGRDNIVKYILVKQIV